MLAKSHWLAMKELPGDLPICHLNSLWCSSRAMRSKTSDQSPGEVCRNSLMVGYQGLSSRSTSQRQSGTVAKGTHTGTPSAPAR